MGAPTLPPARFAVGDRVWIAPHPHLPHGSPGTVTEVMHEYLRTDDLDLRGQWTVTAKADLDVDGQPYSVCWPQDDLKPLQEVGA